jgi:hypothetical protein
MHMHIRTAGNRMKSERVTLLTSPEFKAFLAAEAKREQISVAELVRSRCERRPTEDEATLIQLTAELRGAVSRAKKSLRAGLAEANEVLAELRAKRQVAPTAPKARRVKASVPA